eukprot:483065-Pyramimonas_sp.AAC.1
MEDESTPLSEQIRQRSRERNPRLVVAGCWLLGGGNRTGQWGTDAWFRLRGERGERGPGPWGTYA